MPAPAVARAAFRAAADAADGAQRRRRAAAAQEPAPRRRPRSVRAATWTQLVGEALRSYSRYWLETFRLPQMDTSRDRRGRDADTDGVEHIDAAVERRARA